MKLNDKLENFLISSLVGVVTIIPAFVGYELAFKEERFEKNDRKQTVSYRDNGFFKDLYTCNLTNYNPEKRTSFSSLYENSKKFDFGDINKKDAEKIFLKLNENNVLILESNNQGYILPINCKKN